MRKILTLLVTSTALTAAIGLPSWSAMRDPSDRNPQPSAAIFEEGAQALPLILASGDDDDDDDDGDRGHRKTWRSHDDDHDDDCDDGDDDCRGSARNPAPAGAAAPPQNGLFGSGARPQVRVN